MTNIASTVPANGDVNPYGITVVPQSTGRLVAGDTLVSNFNNAANLQGTGTTIVQVSPWGSVSTFAQIHGPLPGACPGGVGLTTALDHPPGRLGRGGQPAHHATGCRTRPRPVA